MANSVQNQNYISSDGTEKINKVTMDEDEILENTDLQSMKTSTIKKNCPFRLSGSRITLNNSEHWVLKVTGKTVLQHNHAPLPQSQLSASSAFRRPNEAEKKIMNNCVMEKPYQVLAKLRIVNPGTLMSTKDISAYLYRVRKKMNLTVYDLYSNFSNRLTNF